MIRILARSSHPLAPIFHLNGGPGITNMTFPQASRLTAQHDVVMVGYRGVDGSSVLNCPEVTAALEKSADFLGKASLSAYSQAFASCAQRLERSGVDLAGYTLAEQADDIEAARVALGYQRIDLLSESAGTRLAMIYQWRYPNSVDRSVMVGVNPPGNFIYSGAEIDQGIERYSALCAQQSACRARTGNLAASMKHTAAHMPSSWYSLPIKPGNALVGTFLGLTEANRGSPLSGPMTLDSWISAAHGDPSGLWFLSTMAGLVLPSSFAWGEFASIGMADAQPVERYFSSGADRGSIIGNPLGEFLWGAGGMAHAWPANPGENQYTSVQNSNVPTLLIGGTLDFETPAQNATKELLPHLSNGHQVILSGLGHVDDFDAYEPSASTQLLTAFYATGQVDTSRYTPNVVSFTTSSTQTAIAKDSLADNDRLRLVGSDLACGVGDPDPAPRRYRPQDGRMDPFGRSDRVRTRRMVPRRTVGTAVLAEPAARRPAAGSGLDRGADLARGLRRLGPHRHAKGDAGQGHRCRGCRCGGRSRTRFPRDRRAHGVDHDDHRCGGRVEPESARARHLDRAGRVAAMATTPPQPTVARRTPDRVEGLDHDLVVVGHVEREVPVAPAPGCLAPHAAHHGDDYHGSAEEILRAGPRREGETRHFERRSCWPTNTGVWSAGTTVTSSARQWGSKPPPLVGRRRARRGSNALARCSQHHKLLDRGIIGIKADYTINDFQHLIGCSPAADTLVLAHASRPLVVPQVRPASAGSESRPVVHKGGLPIG